MAKVNKLLFIRQPAGYPWIRRMENQKTKVACIYSIKNKINKDKKVI